MSLHELASSGRVDEFARRLAKSSTGLIVVCLYVYTNHCDLEI